MSKKPDLSDLTKKFDIGGIVDNIKSMVNPGGDTPDVDPNDALGIKIAQISVKIQELVSSQAEHTKSLSEINKLLNAAFKDLEALRKQCSDCEACGSNAVEEENDKESSTSDDKENDKESPTSDDKENDKEPPTSDDRDK